MRRRDLLLSGAAGAVVTTVVSSAAFSGELTNAKKVQIKTLPESPILQMRRMERFGPPVLYIHGSTFSSALSVGYRFEDGVSWEDALSEAGFDVWGLDFPGFGGSERPDALRMPQLASPPVLRAPEAAENIERAVHFIREHRGDDTRVSIVAHSWGTVPAAIFVAKRPELVDRFVMFAPILARKPAPGIPKPDVLPAWSLITVPQQLARFVEDVPKGHPPVLAEPQLQKWGPAWLASDPDAYSRTPPAVKTPGGPIADLVDIWTGDQLYHPDQLTRPLMIVRGEWDNLCTNKDVARFAEARAQTPTPDVVIPRSTHLMHLEEGRFELRKSVNAYLKVERP